MNEEMILFGLRLLGAAFLLAFLGTVLFFLRQDVHRQKSSPTPLRQGRLVVVKSELTHPVNGAILPLHPLTTLGRSPASTIPIDYHHASHHHARIIQRMGQWWLEDCQSRNGTRLNGDLVKESLVLSSGDIISIGSLQLRLELEP